MADVPQQLPIIGSNYADRRVSTQEILFAEAASANAAQSGANIHTQPQEFLVGRGTHRTRRRVQREAARVFFLHCSPLHSQQTMWRDAHVQFSRLRMAKHRASFETMFFMGKSTA